MKRIISKNVKPLSTLVVSYQYDDNSVDTIDIREGDMVTIKYLTTDKYEEFATGRITSICQNNMVTYDRSMDIKDAFIIVLDCSEAYQSKVLSIQFNDIQQIIKNVEEEEIPSDDNVDHSTTEETPETPSDDNADHSTSEENGVSTDETSQEQPVDNED